MTNCFPSIVKLLQCRYFYLECHALYRAYGGIFLYFQLSLIKIGNLFSKLGNSCLKDDHGLTALLIAVTSNHVEVVKQLLQAKANVHITLKGKTCLIIAASNANIEMINLLMTYGSSLKQKDWKGKTAIDYAKIHGLKIVAP